MSKTHLTLTKENAGAIAVLTGLIIMAILDVILLVPALNQVLNTPKNHTGQNPIDQEVVKEAIKVINP
jgi:hypothetical protein